MDYRPFSDDETERTHFVKFWMFAAWRTLRHERFSVAGVMTATGMTKDVTGRFCTSMGFCIQLDAPFKESPGTYLLRPELLLGCLDFVELHEARQSTKRAHRLAQFAIGLSVVLGIVSAVVGWMQITRATRLDDAQLQQFVHAAPEQVKLDEDQLQQIVNAGSGQSVTLDGTQVQDIIKATPQPGRGTGWTAGER